MVIIAQNYWKIAISAKEQVKYIESEFEINSIDNQTGKCWRWLFCFFGPGKVKLIKQGGKMVPFAFLFQKKIVILQKYSTPLLYRECDANR